MKVSKISPIEQHVIDFVQKLRTKKGASQADIATIIGSSQAFIASVENHNSRAKYNLNHINAIAEHFGISPQEFLPKKPYKLL